MQIGRNSILLSVLLPFVGGCGNERALEPTSEVRDSAGVAIVHSSGSAIPSGNWIVEPDPILELGSDENDPETLLIYPASIHLDTSGHYVVGDGVFGGRNEVMVFDTVGRLVDRCGGEGEGPGEFGQLWWSDAYRGDSIAVYDLVGHDISLFDRECRFGREIALPRGGVRTVAGAAGFSSGADGVLPDGSILSYPGGWIDIGDDRTPRPAWYVRDEILVRADGSTADTLGRFGIGEYFWNGSGAVGHPFGASGTLTPAGRRIVQGTGSEAEIRLFDPDGDLTRIFRWSTAPAPVTPTEITAYRSWYLDQAIGSQETNDALLQRVRETLEATEYPETMPVYSRVVVSDQGEFWVESYRHASQSFQGTPSPPLWFVFDSTGEWITTVEIPDRFEVDAVYGDRVLGFHVDRFDVRTVRIHRLHRGEADTTDSLSP